MTHKSLFISRASIQAHKGMVLLRIDIDEKITKYIALFQELIFLYFFVSFYRRMEQYLDIHMWLDFKHLKVIL